MNRAWPATLLLLGAAVAWTGPATAQSVVRGVVRSDSGSRRLLGARVRLEPIGRVAQSDLQGRYRLDSLPAGRYAGRAQAIGYRAVEFELVLGPADTLDVDIGLTPEVVRLPDLVAKAPEAKFQSAKMEELERRRQMGLGKFLTRIDLKGKEALPLSNVLRGLAGVRLVMRPSNCGGGFAAATGRGVARRTISDCTARRVRRICFRKPAISRCTSTGRRFGPGLSRTRRISMTTWWARSKASKCIAGRASSRPSSRARAPRAA